MMSPEQEVTAAPRRFRKKSAAERRLQSRRAEGRVVQRLLQAFSSIQCHRGNALSSLGQALLQVLSSAATHVTSAPLHLPLAASTGLPAQPAASSAASFRLPAQPAALSEAAPVQLPGSHAPDPFWRPHKLHQSCGDRAASQAFGGPCAAPAQAVGGRVLPAACSASSTALLRAEAPVLVPAAVLDPMVVLQSMHPLPPPGSLVQALPSAVGQVSGLAAAAQGCAGGPHHVPPAAPVPVVGLGGSQLSGSQASLAEGAVAVGTMDGVTAVSGDPGFVVRHNDVVPVHSHPQDSVAMRPFRQRAQVASDAAVVQVDQSMQAGGTPRSPMSRSELQAIGHRIYLLSVEVCKYHVQEQYVLARQSNREALLVLQGMQSLAITWTPTLLHWEESTRQTL